MIQSGLWQIAHLVHTFFFGDQIWGRIRLAVVILIGWLYAMIFSLIFERAAITSAIVTLQTFFYPAEYLPDPLLYPIAWMLTSQGLRHLIIPFGALLLTLLVGARYIQDMYNLNSLRLSLHYLVASIFAIDYPQLIIEEGKKKLAEGEENLIDLIGGPGYIMIKPGNIVLLERLRGPSNVKAEGRHFITRWEKIKEIASLDDQQDHIDAVKATTNDGIEIEVQNVVFRYRLRTGTKPGDYAERTPENPYPYSIEAMRNMAYNRPVSEQGLTEWKRSVSGAIYGILSDFIARHPLDQLTSPGPFDANPVAKLLNQFYSKGVRERFREIGVDLLWVDVGHFHVVPEDIEQQRLFTWKTMWTGNAKLDRAYGEARRVAMQELGRAEAQAELLMTIVNSLNQSGLSSDPANIRRIILARITQVLEALSQGQKKDGKA